MAIFSDSVTIGIPNSLLILLRAESKIPVEILLASKDTLSLIHFFIYPYTSFNNNNVLKSIIYPVIPNNIYNIIIDSNSPSIFDTVYGYGNIQITWAE